MTSAVMSKDGDAIETYTYDDWNEYVIACILSKYHPHVRFAPKLAPEFKKTMCKYENIYKLFEESKFRHGSLYFLKQLQSLITDDTYCIIRYVEEYYGYDPEDTDPWEYGGTTPYDPNEYQTHTDFRRVRESEKILTENFEDNPMKAFVRFSLGYKDVDCCRETMKIYWIYAFTKSIHFTGIKVPVEKVDLKKALSRVISNGCMISSEQSEILLECVRYQEEQHQKEIEELLAPEGLVYQSAKERFEKMQKGPRDENHF